MPISAASPEDPHASGRAAAPPKQENRISPLPDDGVSDLVPGTSAWAAIWPESRWASEVHCSFPGRLLPIFFNTLSINLSSHVTGVNNATIAIKPNSFIQPFMNPMYAVTTRTSRKFPSADEAPGTCSVLVADPESAFNLPIRAGLRKVELSAICLMALRTWRRKRSRVQREAMIDHGSAGCLVSCPSG